MRRELLDEIIQLKEERKLLKAANGSIEINPHVFSRNEQSMIKSLWPKTQTGEMLMEVERKLMEDEVTFKNEHH